MISADFAPNEDWSDGWLSLKLLFQPWRWYNGKESEEVKKRLIQQLTTDKGQLTVNLYLAGRAALYHLLKSFNLPAGSEIAIQAFTCEAVVLPILALKLKPVYIDIEKMAYSMDPIDLERKITDRTKVVILQHTFGLTPIQMTKIQSVISQKKLVLIHDIAHGTDMSKIKRQKSKVYYLLSFGRSKAFSSVFGGAIISKNKITINQWNNVTMSFLIKLLLYKPLAMLIKSTYDIYIGKILHRLFNLLGLLSQEVTPKEKRGEYDPFLDKAYPNGLAILLLNQLKKFERTQSLRARISAFYVKELGIKNQASSSPLIRFPILMQNKRSEALKRAEERNVYLGKWYDQVVAPKDIDLKRVEYKTGSCPVAEEVCQQIINLPTNISLEDAERVVKTLNDVICK